MNFYKNESKQKCCNVYKSEALQLKQFLINFRHFRTNHRNQKLKKFLSRKQSFYEKAKADENEKFAHMKHIF